MTDDTDDTRGETGATRGTTDTEATDDTDDTEATGDTDDTAATDPGPGPIEPQPITPAAPEAFGRVQVWWGDGKGKTTAAMGMGLRAAGHGYRVHLLQFMKGGAGTVEDVRGEYNAIAALPGFSYENAGHYGWHGSLDATREDAHEERAAAGLERARELLDAAADGDPTTPVDLDAPPEDGVHMLIVDEILYAANRGLIAPADVVDLLDRAPAGLELVLTGGHEEPTYATSEADLVTHVEKRRHHFDEGGEARRGTEY